MSYGQRNRIITIQKKDGTTPDSFGGEVPNWVNIAKVWARVVHLKGRELVAAQAAKSEITTKFNIRYIATITTEMRILYDGMVYDIEFIDDTEEAHRELWIMAKAGRSDG